jgi:hypothetical protein
MKNLNQQRILIVTHPYYEEWANTSKYMRGTHIVETTLVRNHEEVIQLSRQITPYTYSAIVLAPSHGADDAFKISWEPIKYKWTETKLVIKLFERKTRHIHLCCCHQGTFIRREQTVAECAISGYKKYLSGDKPEKYQMRYIVNGCLSRNRYTRAKDHFVYRPANNQRRCCSTSHARHATNNEET